MNIIWQHLTPEGQKELRKFGEHEHLTEHQIDILVAVAVGMITKKNGNGVRVNG